MDDPPPVAAAKPRQCGARRRLFLVQVREWAARQDAAAGERLRAELNVHTTAEDVASDDLYGLAIRLGILTGHDPFLRGRVDEAMRRRATLRKEIRDLEAAAAAEPTPGSASESPRERAHLLPDAIATRRAMLDALGESLKALYVELIRAEDEAVDGGLARASESVGRLEAELEVLAAYQSATASRMMGS